MGLEEKESDCPEPPSQIEVRAIADGNVKCLDKKIARILIVNEGVASIADRGLLMKFWSCLKNSGMQEKHPPVSRLACMVCDEGGDPIGSFRTLRWLMGRHDCGCTPEDLCEQFPDTES